MNIKWPAGKREFAAREAWVLLMALTPRERDVLKGVLEGKTNRQIASILEISVRTVENHRANMMRCLHARHVADAIRIALMARRYAASEISEALDIENSRSAA